MNALADQQRALYAAIKDRRPSVDAATETRFSSTAATATVAHRLDVYRRAYFARLLACLQEDFPRVHGRLGDQDFAALVADYIERYPPHTPSLRDLGRAFPSFVRSQRPKRTDLWDLARLEWAWIEVFDAPDERPLRRVDLAQVPEGAWPNLVLRPIKARRMLTATFPVHLAATKADHPLDHPVSTRVLIWRRDHRVFVRAMTTAEADAFTAVASGAPFAEWCATRDDDVAAAAHRAVQYLTAWLEEGLLADIAYSSALTRRNPKENQERQ